MTSVRTEAQKRVTSEATEEVSNGGHDDHRTDTPKSEDLITTTELQPAVRVSSSYVKTDCGVKPKRPKLLRKIILQGLNVDSKTKELSSPKSNDDLKTNSKRSHGMTSQSVISPSVNGLDPLRDDSLIKSDDVPVCLCEPPLPVSPYVKLWHLPSSMTVPLNRGQSVNLTEIMTDWDKDREIVHQPYNCIKVEPDIEAMIPDENTCDSNEKTELSNFFSPPRTKRECSKSPVKNILDHVNNEVGEHTNTEKRKRRRCVRASKDIDNNSNDTEKRKRRWCGRASKGIDNSSNDTEKRKKGRCGRASKGIDNNSEKDEMPDSVGCDDLSQKRRSRGIPRRHDDFVYDVEEMVVGKVKTEAEPKRNSVLERKVWKWVYRPKNVTRKSKLKKTSTEQNNKKKVKSAAKDIQLSKKTKKNLHHEKVPVSPKDPGSMRSQRKSIYSPNVEVLDVSNTTEHNGNCTSDKETSPRVSEMEEKPSSPLIQKCKTPGRRYGSIGEFIKDETCYIVVSRGTQRGANRLVGADGYTYNSTRSNSSGNLYWRCSFRPLKEPACNVVVKKVGTDYMKKNAHSHLPDANAFVKSLVSAKLKKKCLTDFMHSPREVVEKILEENEHLISPTGGQFNAAHLVRRFNRSRKQLKDKNPLITSLKFRNATIESFLIEDVVFGRKRHMIFATKKQLQLLGRSDRWYIDITSKFERKPFTHLLSISAYVQDDTKGDDRLKLKPLTFVMMSSLEVTDIVKVLRALLKHLRKPILVRSFVLDFFEPLWKGVRHLFFNCKLYGCAWKFGQCIWTKIQKLGIKNDDRGLYDEIHRLLKLPFVHPKKVRSTYEMLKVDFLSDPAFEDFIKYLEYTWMNGQVWKISNWCVHGNPFRTKIEVLGWHYAVHVKNNSAFIDNFLNELHMIAVSIPHDTRPAHQRTVQKHYLENESTPQGKIYKLWAQESSIGTYDFLSLCCELSEPTMEGMVEKMIEEFCKREEHL